MSHALAERYGRWAVGWRWAHDEGDFDGGPVGSWCCPRDSVTTPEETLTRVVHCHQVLTWFLSRRHVADSVAKEMVGQAIGGRFHSWTSPDTVLVDDIAERLALSVRPDAALSPSEAAPDHLERWLAVRASVPWQDAAESGSDEPVTPSRDGAAESIRAFDGAIDPARAEGLLTALERARADATQDAPLTLERLCDWQQRVLGVPQPPRFRNSVAFAKGGRERYGIAPDTPARLEACLAESGSDDRRPLPLIARAARAYLDVCFFHPFDDGNARAGFLALVFVLAREGVALDDVSLLRRVSFQADSPQDPLTLIRYIDLHLAQTRQRAASHGRATD
ncbi:Fic family protein [Actinomadura luteofluorescens]